MKRIITIFMILTMVLSVVQVSANEVITVTVNDEKVEFDVPPMTVNDRTMVPLRAIFEKLGATVSYNDATREITAKRENTVVKLTVDSNIMYVNEKEIVLDVTAFETGGRTLVPVRAISEAFGCLVNWHEEEKFVEIIDGNQIVGTVSDSKNTLYIRKYEVDWGTPEHSTADVGFEAAKKWKVTLLKAMEYGVFLDESEVNEIQSKIDGYFKNEATATTFTNYLNNYGITAEQYVELLKTDKHITKFYSKMDELGLRKKVTEEEMKSYFEKRFIKAQHILISDKATAYEVSDKIRAGEPFESFRDLCEDPGSKTLPEGYVFAKTVGETLRENEKSMLSSGGFVMVESFETAAAALKIGEISQPVKSNFGYHIIKRVEITSKDYENNKDAIFRILDLLNFNETEKEWINACKIEKYM